MPKCQCQVWVLRGVECRQFTASATIYYIVSHAYLNTWHLGHFGGGVEFSQFTTALAAIYYLYDIKCAFEHCLYRHFTSFYVILRVKMVSNRVAYLPVSRLGGEHGIILIRLGTDTRDVFCQDFEQKNVSPGINFLPRKLSQRH